MIKIKLCELMGRERMTRKRLAELTDIRPNTIGDYYKGNIRKIDIHSLNKICSVFHCNISDLLEYIPDSFESDGENKND